VKIVSKVTLATSAMFAQWYRLPCTASPAGASKGGAQAACTAEHAPELIAATQLYDYIIAIVA